MKEQCKKCGKSNFIVNKRYCLCEVCNCLRLHGKQPFERAVIKEKEPNNTIPNKRPKRAVKGLNTVKKTTMKREAQRLADLETYYAVFSNCLNICQECGCILPADFKDEDGRLNCLGQYSHILSKGSHPEFRNDYRNFNRLCPPCHDNWEFGQKSDMKIYSNNQKIIQILYDERSKKRF